MMRILAVTMKLLMSHYINGFVHEWYLQWISRNDTAVFNWAFDVWYSYIAGLLQDYSISSANALEI